LAAMAAFPSTALASTLDPNEALPKATFAMAVGAIERRYCGFEFRDHRGSRANLQPPAGTLSAPLESVHGLIQYRVVVSHRRCSGKGRGWVRDDRENFCCDGYRPDGAGRENSPSLDGPRTGLT
jgi:hypothetical protein